jgi:hypothetical protein
MRSLRPSTTKKCRRSSPRPKATPAVERSKAVPKRGPCIMPLASCSWKSQLAAPKETPISNMPIASRKEDQGKENGTLSSLPPSSFLQEISLRSGKQKIQDRNHYPSATNHLPNHSTFIIQHSTFRTPSDGEQMIITTFPQPPSLHPSRIFLRSFKKSISLVQPVLCARISKNPPTSENPAQKVFFDTPFSSRKHSSCAPPTNGHLEIASFFLGKKSARRKKSRAPVVGSSPNPIPYLPRFVHPKHSENTNGNGYNYQRSPVGTKVRL